MRAPAREDRLLEPALVSFDRWQVILARHPPPQELNGGPPCFPVNFLIPAARELRASLVISHRPLIGEVIADEADLTFALAGADAIAQIRRTLQVRLTHDALRECEPAPPPPVILVVDTSSAQIAALLQTIAVAEVACHLVAVAQDGAEVAGDPDPLTLMSTAHAHLGTRPAGQITHLVPMGKPYNTGRASPPLVQLLAAQFTYRSRPVRMQAAPGTVVHWNSTGLAGVDVLHIVTPDSCNAACVSMIQRSAHGIAEAGLDMEWSTTLLRLPRDPEFLEPGLEALAHHVIQIRSADAAQRHAPRGTTALGTEMQTRRALARLQAEAQDLATTDIRVSTWRRQETADIVHTALRRPAMCMAYAYAVRAAAAFNHRVGLTPTGIMLIGTPEATAAAILEHLRETMPGAISRNGQPQATTPVRLTLEGTFESGPSFVNISDPEMGYQRRWNIANLGQGDERERSWIPLNVRWAEAW